MRRRPGFKPVARLRAYCGTRKSGNTAAIKWAIWLACSICAFILATSAVHCCCPSAAARFANKSAWPFAFATPLGALRRGTRGSLPPICGLVCVAGALGNLSRLPAMLRGGHLHIHACGLFASPLVCSPSSPPTGSQNAGNVFRKQFAGEPQVRSALPPAWSAAALPTLGRGR